MSLLCEQIADGNNHELSPGLDPVRLGCGVVHVTLNPGRNGLEEF